MNIKDLFIVKLLLLLFLAVLNGCSDDNLDVDSEPDPDPIIVIPTYSSDRSSNLNVVYFIPKNKDTLSDYQRRISGIILHTQEWYKKEMDRNGFGQKTFGLLVDDNNSGLIKIIVIKGQDNSDQYPYQGGGSKARTEVETYFNQNPSESTSDHTVIFMPSREGDHGWDAGGVPFYGLGKWCFVLDYKYFDMGTWRDGTQEGSSNWIGGTIHEIGHALNLPHNQHKVNDGWTSMMSWGNHEYNDSPNNVHLTKASTTILNNNQVFNFEDASEYYIETPSHTIQSLKIYADDTNLYLRSKFDATVPVNAVNVYNDPKTSDTDADYNAITWATTDMINNDSISVVMPLAEIHQDYKQYPFDLRVRFCHTNGNFSYESFQYEFENGMPDIDINVREIDEVDKSNWTIADSSSEESLGEGTDNGHAIHVIDGNSETFWHTAWSASQPDYPHSITINMSTDQAINGFTFSPRTTKYNGRPKDITVETSTDGETFESIGDFTLGDSSAKQVIELDNSITTRYFKLIITSGHDNGSGENVFFTHLAEVGAF